jgi:hypothetical protein
MGRRGDRVYQRKQDIDWEVLLGRVLDLPEAEQLKVHQGLTESLGDRLGKETARAKQARVRHEAVEALQAAAEHLGLPAGQAPLIREFKRAAGETELPMTFNAVYEAFEQNWETASRFYRKQPVPATAAQRGVRRAILGRNRTDKEPPLSGLRLFLAQDPPPRSTCGADYQAWAREMNEDLPLGCKRLVESPEQIHESLRASWNGCLAVARNETTLEAAQQQLLDQMLAEAGPLVGHVLASWMLGLSNANRVSSRRGYPEPVFCLRRGNWLWRMSDIRAYGEGKSDFRHPKGHLQNVYMQSYELAERLNLGAGALQMRLDKAHAANDWENVPRPAGKTAQRNYWERAFVERWLEEHPFAKKGSKSGRWGPRRDRKTLVRRADSN